MKQKQQKWTLKVGTAVLLVAWPRCWWHGPCQVSDFGECQVSD